MATLNLYVPDALKAQMDEIEGRNWSAVAQEAFRTTVNQEKAKTMNTEAIAERIRKTSGTNSALYKAGFAEGERWAATEAEADDLEVIERLDVDEALSLNELSAITVATHLAQEMGAADATYLFGDDGDHNWRSDVPSKITANRLRGFVAGAQEVYKQVKSHL